MRQIQRKCAAARNFAGKLSLLLATCAVVSACEPTTNTAPVATNVAAEETSSCGDEGFLRVNLYGAIETHLAWASSDLDCMGMPRPANRGARLRFAGRGPGEDQRIAIIVAIPDLRRDALGEEYRSNVTLIEEGAGRFFSTPNLDNCLTDITSLFALDDTGDRFSIGGRLYCVTPLPEVNGDSSVSFSELSFSGLIDWSAS